MPVRLSRPGIHRATTQHSAGLSAVELMVVVLLVAVLAALALPDFQGLIERYRIRTATEDLTAALYFARTEAIKRGGRVSLARRDAHGDCTPSVARDWRCGWQVFLDADEDGVLDATQGETVLQISPAHPHLLIAIRGRTTLVYNRWGGFNGASIAGFGISRPGREDAPGARGLCLSSTGRIKTVVGSTGC